MKRFLIPPVVLMLGVLAFGQQEFNRRPDNDLIAWSGMQSPQPLQPAQADSAVHAVTGSISKEGDTYVLKVSDTTSYKLDDQQKAKQYNGQKVRVTGEVDLNTNQIHVQKIEPLV